MVKMSETPTCAMCARPARWLETRQTWARYCSGMHCSSRDRICKTCGGPFVMKVDGAGTRYCSPVCQGQGYDLSRSPRLAPVCAWCKVTRARHVPRSGVWPYICAPCLQPIRHLVAALKKHHVPHDLARRLTVDPGCEVCGVDIVTVRSTTRALCQVDHDHRCCPGPTSCGRCVRGMVCGGCNAAMGQIRDNPETALAMAVYLDRDPHRQSLLAI